jgi:hypothetical protein
VCWCKGVGKGRLTRRPCELRRVVARVAEAAQRQID